MSWKWSAPRLESWKPVSSRRKRNLKFQASSIREAPIFKLQGLLLEGWSTVRKVARDRRLALLMMAEASGAEELLDCFYIHALRITHRSEVVNYNVGSVLEWEGGFKQVAANGGEL